MGESALLDVRFELDRLRVPVGLRNRRFGAERIGAVVSNGKEGLREGEGEAAGE